MSKTSHVMPQSEFAQHVQTYRAFLRIAFLFAAHVAVILILLAYFFT